MVQKGGKFWRTKERTRRWDWVFFLEKDRRVGGSCGRKPHTLFWYNKILSVVLGFFSTKLGIMLQFGLMFLVIWINIDFYGEFYVQLLCESFVVLDEINYIFVSGVFYNVFWSANYGYMQ